MTKTPSLSMCAVILAGGLSRRMNGNEKALLHVHSMPLIEQAYMRLNKQVDTIIINANGEPDRFEWLELPVVQDTVEGFAGPLAGVLAGMRWAQDQEDIDLILTVAADTPFFPADYAKRMLDHRTETQSDIVLAASGGNRHPVFGLWTASLANQLEYFLIAEQGRKVMQFVERYPHALVDFEIEDHDPFFNVNTPEDLKTAKAMVIK